MARMQAERRLREAEESLHKLGHAVEHETPSVHQEVKEEMVVNVNKLKSKDVESSIRNSSTILLQEYLNHIA